MLFIRTAIKKKHCFMVNTVGSESFFCGEGSDDKGTLSTQNDRIIG